MSSKRLHSVSFSLSPCACGHLTFKPAISGAVLLSFLMYTTLLRFGRVHICLWLCFFCCCCCFVFLSMCVMSIWYCCRGVTFTYRCCVRATSLCKAHNAHLKKKKKHRTGTKKKSIHKVKSAPPPDSVVDKTQSCRYCAAATTAAWTHMCPVCTCVYVCVCADQLKP
jgi:hypothetical protein